MKTIFIFFFACIATAAQAQLLIQTDLIPEAGETFASHVVYNAASLQPGNGGLTATWDWSNAQYSLDSFSVKQCMPSSSTPHAALFPGSNFAMKSYNNFAPGSVSYNYFLLDTNLHYFYLGNKGDVFTQVYSNPIEQFHFPFGYNNTSYDAYCFESSALGSTFNFCGNTMLHFDGVGTLMLPYGTYTGVYRLRFERYAVEQSTPADTTFSTVYYWYKPGIHHPLATYEEFISSDGVAFIGASVLSQFITGVNDLQTSEAINVYPNPFHQVVSVDINARTKSEQIISVHAMNGKMVYESKASAGTNTVDMSELPTGVYMLCVSDGATIRRQLVVKE